LPSSAQTASLSTLKVYGIKLISTYQISGTETHPAAKTQSLGLSAYAQLAQVFAEPSGSFTETPNPAPSTGIWPSTGIIPPGRFTVTQNSQHSTGIIPFSSLP